MERHKFEELLEERAGLHTQMVELNDAAEAEGRDLTAEEAGKYDQLETQFDSISKRIKRAEKLEDNTPTLTPGRPVADAKDERELSKREVIASDEYRDAFATYMRGGERAMSAEQRSILKVGAAEEGGSTVPEEWRALYEPLLEAGTIRGLAEVIQTSGGGTLHLPKVTADAEAPAIEGETEEIANDAETFGEVELGAFKYAQIVKATDEFVQDSMVDVNSFVGRRAGFRIGRAQNADWIAGDGEGEPKGLFAGATVGKTGASETAITLDEILDLTYSVTPPYRRGAVYIAKDSTVLALRKLKDKNEQYLWQPAVQAGQPDMLNGYPIYSDPDVDALGKAKKPLGFGNVGLAYTIRDAGGVSVLYLVERYADTGHVAWRVQQRSDGDIIDSGAFKVFQNKVE